MATGFDAITGAWDRIDVRGAGGRTLAEKWRDGPSTYFGLMTHGFPNLLMVAGPQSVSGSTNDPRAIESGVDWVKEWGEEVVAARERMRLRAAAANERVGRLAHAGVEKASARPPFPTVEAGASRLPSRVPSDRGSLDAGRHPTS